MLLHYSPGVGMIEFTHQALVFISKTYGLFYLLALSFLVLIYTLWPNNRRKFDKAAKSILNAEEGPWR